jgi:hypothetical protein
MVSSHQEQEELEELVPTGTGRSTRGNSLGLGQRRVQIGARAAEARATGAGHVSLELAED